MQNSSKKRNPLAPKIQLILLTLPSAQKKQKLWVIIVLKRAWCGKPKFFDTKLQKEDESMLRLFNRKRMPERSSKGRSSHKR